MSTDYDAEYIAALVDLHRGCDRKGPGDAGLARRILDSLTTVPPHPRMADMGCGSGAGALLLAQYYQSPVRAVDASRVFIDELIARAQQLGLEHWIIPIHGDMAQLDWPAGSIDLLWSEGAAYNLGFERALEIWRSLLTDSGIAVISELSWFVEDAPEPAIAYWQTAYPAMGTEAENMARARRAGFDGVATHRLPSQAWWDNYYGPLREQMGQLPPTPAHRSVVRDTEAEMELFERFSDAYGYTFYVLRAA